MFYRGGKLAADLTLPKLEARWAGTAQGGGAGSGAFGDLAARVDAVFGDGPSPGSAAAIGDGLIAAARRFEAMRVASCRWPRRRLLGLESVEVLTRARVSRLVHWCTPRSKQSMPGQTTATMGCVMPCCLGRTFSAGDCGGAVARGERSCWPGAGGSSCGGSLGLVVRGAAGGGVRSVGGRCRLGEWPGCGGIAEAPAASQCAGASVVGVGG